jgi:hypothetical protein
MMEAARIPETLVNFYQTTRLYIPEDSHLHTSNHPQEGKMAVFRRWRNIIKKSPLDNDNK